MRVLCWLFDAARGVTPLGLRGLGCVFAVVLAMLPEAASAQFFQEEDPELRRQRREAHSPRLENALLQAQSVLESNPDLGLDILQSIFDAPEDSYFVTRTGCSLKDAAELLVVSEESVLKGYQRRFESAAGGVLEKARSDGGLRGLREVTRRYALTTAGRTAMMELSVAACDSGDAATALRLVQRLRRLPSDVDQFEPRMSLIEIWAQRELRNDPAAAERLKDLKSRFPEALVIDGRRIAWFADDSGRDRWLSSVLAPRGPLEPVSGLPEWRMAHGDRRRNAPASDAPPFLDSAWEAPLADRFDDIRKYDEPWNGADIKLVNQSALEVESRFRKEGLHPLPVAAPLLTSDLAIFAGFGSVKAFRLQTGELAWSSEPVDETLLALLAGTDASIRKPSLMLQLVGQRAYRDHVDASLSTDGKRVYHIGHSGLIGLQPNSGTLPMSNRGASPLLPRNYNYLQAYDINGGRCVWSIGGPPRRLEAAFDRVEDEFSFDGVFFSSAPIPWEDQLLCIVEQSRQLRIVSIDPSKNPQDEPPYWSQALLNSDQDLVYSADRRFTGVNVALDGSTLIAALGNGTVIGFDVADRRWLWLHTYTDPLPVDYRRMLQPSRISKSVTDEAQLETALDLKGWSDTRTLIHGRRVLVTPFDDSRLLCLDRQSGQLLWDRERDQAMTLAGVQDDIVMLIGKSDVRGLRLEDGQPVWSTPIPPASGRGVRMGSRYVLPLSTGEVLTLDIRTGVPIARSPLTSGDPAGNLVAAGGMLVTQTAAEFRAFRAAGDVHKEIEQRLAASPNDAVALGMRGELKLHQGDVAGGEKDLRSIEDPSPRIKQVLAWALVNGLERDFASYYKPDLDLDALPSDAGLRAQGWSAVSRGLQARGDLPGALLAAVRSGESLNSNADRLLDREESLRVRENRLIRGRIEDLWGLMSPAQREQSVGRIRERLEQVKPASLEHFRIHELLAGRVLPADLELQHLRRRTMLPALIEQRLLRLRESSDAAIAAGANLELLKIAAADPRITPAPAVVSELTGRLKDVPLDDGKPAGELAAAILGQPEFTRRREAAKVLSGELVATGLDDTAGISELSPSLVESGPRSLLLEGWSFSEDGRQSQIIAMDGRGDTRINERVNRGSGVPNRISTSGRLILVETVDGFRVFDAVTTLSVLSTTLAGESFENLMIPGNFRGRSSSPRSSNGRLAALHPDHLSYIKRDQLLVVDPLTSREHWTRTIEGIVDVTSDADFIAVQDRAGKIKVFRASDGRFVRETEIKPDDLIAEYRRDVQRLIRTETDDGIEIGLLHPAYGTWAWQKQFPAGTRIGVLDARLVGVLAPGGRFSLLADDDGRELWTSPLEPPEDLHEIRVFQDRARVYVVAVRRPIGIEFFPGSIPRPQIQAVNARVFALSREGGGLLWTRDFDRLIPDFNQPGLWPFFVFMASSEPDEANENRQTPMAYIVERATGKTLHAAEQSSASSLQRGWRIDAAGSVSIKVGGVGMRVSQGAEAVPPPPPVAKPAD